MIFNIFGFGSRVAVATACYAPFLVVVLALLEGRTGAYAWLPPATCLVIPGLLLALTLGRILDWKYDLGFRPLRLRRYRCEVGQGYLVHFHDYAVRWTAAETAWMTQQLATALIQGGYQRLYPEHPHLVLLGRRTEHYTLALVSPFNRQVYIGVGETVQQAVSTLLTQPGARLGPVNPRAWEGGW